jgi:hypothetical protein
MHHRLSRMELLHAVSTWALTRAACTDGVIIYINPNDWLIASW